jgi:hypothetical protein
MLCCVYLGNPVVGFYDQDPPIVLNYFPACWGWEALEVMMRDFNGYPSREGEFCLPLVGDNHWMWNTAATMMRDVLHWASQLLLFR